MNCLDSFCIVSAWDKHYENRVDHNVVKVAMPWKEEDK